MTTPDVDYETRATQLRVGPYQTIQEVALLVASTAEKCAKLASWEATMPAAKRVEALAKEREGLAFLVERIHTLRFFAHMNADGGLLERDLYRLGVRTRSGKEWDR